MYNRSINRIYIDTILAIDDIKRIFIGYKGI